MFNPAYLDRLAQVESGKNPLAKNVKSSAKGLYQFIDSTAQQYGINAEFGTPEYTMQETEAAKKFTTDNYNTLKSKLGRDPSHGELYLAHQQGADGAAKILSQPDQKAVDVLGRDEVLNNGGNENMTAAEFASKWTSKFDNLDAEEKGLIQDQEQAAKSTEFADLYDSMIADGENNSVQANISNKNQQSFADLYDSLSNDVNTSAEFYENPAGDTQMIDRDTGAPSYIRAIVGSVYDDADRLATIQQYYPDAQPYDDGNFIYTSPETGRPTVFNPKGMDMGDIAGATRELMVTVGSGLGAAAGATAGLGVASAPGAVIGAGFGAAFSGSAYDALVAKYTKDNRGLGRRVVEVAGEGMLGATGEVVGRAVAPLAKKALGGASTAAQNVINAFKQFGIEPSLPAVTGGKGMARIEAGLAQTPSSADIIAKQVEKTVKQTQDAVSGIVKQYGTPKSVQETGEVIKQATIKAGERIGFRQEQLYNEAYDAMGENVLVDVKSSKQLLKDMMQEVANAPKSMAPKLKSAMTELSAVISDAGENGIDFQALRKVRTAVGKDLDNPFTQSGAENAARKRIYAALSEDLANVAEQVSPEAAKMLKRADRYTRIYETQYRQTMNKIMKYDAEEKAYNFALSGAEYGGSSLKKLKTLFQPEEWDTVSASVLNKLGKATAGQQDASGEAFSINTFLTNWNKLSPEAKHVLFNTKGNKETYQALNELTGLMSKLKEVGRSQNTSNTAGAINTMVMLQGLGGAGAGLMAGNGDISSIAGYGLGAVLAPKYAAKLITSPKFIEWLAAPIEQGISSIPAHIAKLTALANEDELLREPIQEFIKILGKQTE